MSDGRHPQARQQPPPYTPPAIDEEAIDTIIGLYLARLPERETLRQPLYDIFAAVCYLEQELQRQGAGRWEHGRLHTLLHHAFSDPGSPHL